MRKQQHLFHLIWSWSGGSRACGWLSENDDFQSIFWVSKPDLFQSRQNERRGLCLPDSFTVNKQPNVIEDLHQSREKPDNIQQNRKHHCRSGFDAALFSHTDITEGFRCTDRGAHCGGLGHCSVHLTRAAAHEQLSQQGGIIGSSHTFNSTASSVESCSWQQTEPVTGP